MNKISTAVLLVIFSIQFSIAQKATKPVFGMCGKMGNCTMTWDEFMSCKKELTTTDKSLSIGSFLLTIQKAERKDTISIEFMSKGNKFSKTALETIEKLHKSKKMGGTVVIDKVQVLQSGKDARIVSPMIIYIK